MGAIIIILGIGWIVYNLVKEGIEPVNHKFLDWDNYNKDAMSGRYSKKEMQKRFNRGDYFTDNKKW